MELINGLTPEEASWRPSKGRHNIYEILKHSNFWKKAVICHLKKRPMSSDERRNGNWTRIKRKVTKKQWEDCINETKKVHDEMKSEILSHGKELHNINSDVSNYAREVINHESYHAGQIGLIRAMLGYGTII